MSADLPAKTKTPRRRARLWIVVPLLFMGLGLGLLLYPRSFRVLVRLALEGEAKRRGGKLEIERVDGSLFAPIEIIRPHFRQITEAGAKNDLRLERATVHFAPGALFSSERSFFESLELRGGRLTIDLEREDGPRPSPRHFQALPGRLAVRNLDIAITAGDISLLVRNLGFGAASGAMGPFHARAIEWRSPRYRKTLSNAVGRTDLRDGWLSIVSLQIDDRIVVENASMQVNDLLDGRLDAFFEVTAFGGSVRGQIATRFEEGRSELDASGFFYRIDVPALARFLGSTAPASGIIEEGKFSFRGDPLRPDRSTGSMRLQAGDFQWGERRWDSLTAAGTLVAQRLEVTDFKLVQAGNSLAAKGEIQLGHSVESWLASDFRLDLKARITDLGALSDLFGPKVARWKGSLNAQGSVHGHEKRFNGQIIVEGNDIHYGDTPIDELHAALRLNGNDLELTNFALVRGEDYARGRGGIKILGTRHYWGEINFDVADLADYRAIPGPPHFPWPLQGSARGQWSGDGSLEAHSGAIDLRLRDLVRPGSGGSPLDVDVTATYSPDNVYVTRGRIGHGDLFLTSEVNATPERTQFRQLKVESEGETRASGTVSVPVGFAWLRPNASRGMPAGELEADLTFDRFRLSEAWRLLGREALTRGQISGELQTHGPLGAFMADGNLQMTDGKMSEALLGLPVSEVTAEAIFEGGRARLPQFSADVFGGKVSGAGDINLRNLLDPSLRLGLSGRGATLARGELEAEGDFNVTVTGLLSQAYVDGAVVLTKATVQNAGDALSILQPDREGARGTPYSLSIVPELRHTFLSDWRYDLAVTSERPLLLAPDARITPALQVQGQPDNLKLGGRIDFEAKGAAIAGGPAAKYTGSLYLLDRPVLAARAVEKQQEWLLLGPSDRPDRIVIAEDFPGVAKVWPRAERVAPDPSLDTFFEMNLAAEPLPTVPPHEH